MLDKYLEGLPAVQEVKPAQRKLVETFIYVISQLDNELVICEYFLNFLGVEHWAQEKF